MNNDTHDYNIECLLYKRQKKWHKLTIRNIKVGSKYYFQRLIHLLGIHSKTGMNLFHVDPKHYPFCFICGKIH